MVSSGGDPERSLADVVPSSVDVGRVLADVVEDRSLKAAHALEMWQLADLFVRMFEPESLGPDERAVNVALTPDQESRVDAVARAGLDPLGLSLRLRSWIADGEVASRCVLVRRGLKVTEVSRTRLSAVIRQLAGPHQLDEGLEEWLSRLDAGLPIEAEEAVAEAPGPAAGGPEGGAGVRRLGQAFDDVLRRLAGPDEGAVKLRHILSVCRRLLELGLE